MSLTELSERTTTMTKETDELSASTAIKEDAVTGKLNQGVISQQFNDGKDYPQAKVSLRIGRNSD